MGQEWLSLYVVRSENKGDPILADSLTLQYGSSDLPNNCTQKLHFFGKTFAADLGDTAYSYNNKKNGVYFFWKTDTEAFADTRVTASAFTPGYLALAGLGGLGIGILGASITMAAKNRRKKEEAAS